MVKRLMTDLVLAAAAISIFLSGCSTPQQLASYRSPAKPVELSDRNIPKNVVADHGIVAAAHPLAAQAGLEILRRGGNAIDAAIATGLAIGVVEPYASGLAGGGFIVIHTKDGQDLAIDFRGMAPAFVDRQYKADYLLKGMPGRTNYRSVLVPGLLAGYEAALKKYGTMDFAEVVKPAIRLAEEGFPCPELLNKVIMDHFDQMLENNAEEDVPFLSDGLPVAPGEIVKQPKLANALRLIGEKGVYGAFYEGPIGQSMVETLNRSGSKISMKDMNAYKPALRVPVKGNYRGYQIISMPPTSSGGLTVIETLNILENFSVGKWQHNSVEHLHYLKDATRIAFADRNKYIADPDFVDVPTGMILSKKYAQQRAKEIKPNSAISKPRAGVPDDEHWSTTHFSVADADGNIVAVTQTIVSFFGSNIFDPKYGFCYNNELISFSSNEQSVNSPEVGKRPRSSMTPTVVLDKNGKAFMTLGSPGSTRIINTVTQIISNAIDFGMSMDEAIEAPRMAGSASGKLYLEGHISDVEAKTDALVEMGYNVVVKEPFDLYFGGAQGIMFKDGKLYGGADSRRDGAAVGY